MTKVNLFDIGKAFYQRAYRDPTHAGKAKALRLSDDLWHNKKDKRELLELIAQIKCLEQRFSGIRVYYADIAEKAVRNGNYFISIPHEIAHRYNDRPGRVYVLTAASRRQQCKLGATTMTLLSRCLAYERKYGYSVEDFFCLETRTPFTLEKKVASQIADLRIAGNTIGDSIGWYRITPSALKDLIIQMNAEL